MGAVAFFYADSGNSLIDRCLELALVYHCDPFLLLDHTDREINEVYKRTSIIMKRMKAD